MSKRSRFTEEDRKRIEDAVKTAEARTSGEIVPMVIPSSDPYPEAHWACGVILVLVSAALAHRLAPGWSTPAFSAVLAGAFLLGYFLGAVPAVKRLVAGRARMAFEVDQRACAAFVTHGIANTKSRTGVLLLVSLLERRVIVLADSGIHSRVPEGTWKSVTDDAIQAIQRGRVVDGLGLAIARVGAVLAEKFPAQSHDSDELANRLVEDGQ